MSQPNSALPGRYFTVDLLVSRVLDLFVLALHDRSCTDDARHPRTAAPPRDPTHRPRSKPPDCSFPRQPDRLVHRPL